MGSGEDCLVSNRVLAPEVDIVAARLDRHRHAERLAESDGRGTVGPEALGGDDVEGEASANSRDEVDQHRRKPVRVAMAGRWIGYEGRAADAQTPPVLELRLMLTIVRSTRRDHAHLDIGPLRQCQRLRLDEVAQAWPIGIGEQCRQDQ